MGHIQLCPNNDISYHVFLDISIYAQKTSRTHKQFLIKFNTHEPETHLHGHVIILIPRSDQPGQHSSSPDVHIMSALLICHSLTRCLFSLPFCWSQRRSPVSVLFFPLLGSGRKYVTASCPL